MVIKASHAGCALATANQWREDNFLADAYCGDIRADVGDFTGDIAAWNMRKWNRNARDTATHPQIEMIQRAGLHANENFIRPDSWLRSVGEFQDVRCAMLVKDNRFHETSGSSWRFRTVALGRKSVQKAACIDTGHAGP